MAKPDRLRYVRLTGSTRPTANVLHNAFRQRDQLLSAEFRHFKFEYRHENTGSHNSNDACSNLCLPSVQWQDQHSRDVCITAG
jgi:hypothetical protein